MTSPTASDTAPAAAHASCADTAPRTTQVVVMLAQPPQGADAERPPKVVGRGEFVRRHCEALTATALRGAPPHILTYRPCASGTVATLEHGGEKACAHLPEQLAAGRVVVDKGRALPALVPYLDCEVANLRKRRDAGQALRPSERRVVHLWAAARGQVEAVSDEFAERLTGDTPDLVKAPGVNDRLVWDGVARITPKTPDTDAAAKVAQLIVDIGGEDLISLAAGVLYAAFDEATATAGSRYWTALICQLDHGEPAA